MGYLCAVICIPTPLKLRHRTRKNLGSDLGSDGTDPESKSSGPWGKNLLPDIPFVEIKTPAVIESNLNLPQFCNPAVDVYRVASAYAYRCSSCHGGIVVTGSG